MERRELSALLRAVARGDISPENAAEQIGDAPLLELSDAMPDLQRGLRQDVGEVIFGAGKTGEQIARIAAALRENGQERVLITRLAPEKLPFLEDLNPLYDETARAALIGEMPKPDGRGFIAVVTAGTSDLPAAQEAVFTAKALGNEVRQIHDAGVAGLHRLLSKADVLAQAAVVIAVAGMEGALPSVIGGLVRCPVIAVPTSAGYGASFGGVSALLAMLNSCASGVTVVNIDNGFGAAFAASRINHIGT